jgi:putative ABC transport system ATP-binding protein
MIELQNVHKIYVKGRVKVPALRGVNLNVTEQEFLVVQGPSGSGKSTLLNIIGLLDEPTDGRLRLFGEPTQGLPDRERSRLRGRSIGFVFQSFNLISHLRAWENVALPLYYAGVGRAERHQRAITALKQVGLSERAEHLPAELSGGEEQRVAIARALVIGPKLILADEPTGNLDSESSLDVMKEFSHLNKEGATLLIATHDPLVTSFAERILALRDGQIVDEVSPNRGEPRATLRDDVPS